MSRYKLAIFDMDGTILDTLEDLADSVNYALEACGMPKRSIEEVRKFVGNGIRKLIERAVAHGADEEQINQVFDTFNNYYKDHCAIKTKAYDGIVEVISELRKAGIKTAVVSNKADYGVQSLCESYFKGLFDFAVGEREGVRRKPYPDSVLAVLDRFEISRENAVYIGDSEVDYETSVNAEVDSIMVTWGFRDEDFIRSKGARVFVNKPHELLEFFE